MHFEPYIITIKTLPSCNRPGHMQVTQSGCTCVLGTDNNFKLIMIIIKDSTIGQDFKRIMKKTDFLPYKSFLGC